MESYKIPKKPEKFQAGTMPKVDLSPNQDVVYEPVKGEKIKVVLWIKYPDYDMIFGVPDATNPKHEKEAGFFQIRDTRQKKILQGAYLDLIEVDEFLEGMRKIKVASKKNSKHLWEKLNRK